MEICNYCKHKIKHHDSKKHTCRPKMMYEKFIKYDEAVSALVNTGYSILYITNNSFELFGEILSRKNIINACKRTNTDIPSIKTAANSTITRNLYKHTVEIKYGDGITNVSQSSIIKNKKLLVNLSRYGVENQFQRLEIKELSKKTMMEKYGVENPVQLAKVSNGRLSKTHKKISDYLNSINIEHKNDYGGQFKKYNELLERDYCPIPDIFIENMCLVIEIYGDYWHMNPKIYKPTDVIRFFTGEHSAQEKWMMDDNRKQHIESFGIQVLILWENDIKYNFEKVKQQITEFIWQQ